MTNTVLRIDASARTEGSVSRQLADEIIAKLAPAKTITRDLAAGLPLMDAAWIGANFTPDEDKTDLDRQTLALSDALVAELKAADTVLIALPIYNFGVPTSLKAWVDLVARARVTFRYTEDGPEGLLTGKRAILAIASGGTEVDGPIDYATPYLRHILNFMGITDIQVVRSDRMAVDPQASSERAHEDIAQIAA
ncbi:FMN-dependent NADH-azoreductase [Tropicibacter naphthalenivorans]|uniref:FMN dependent NADH:quinone oxidoreductase n=1 Tax=Tropicibacter naphthalenivorans TaxID=441103 RepID=A0A0N7LYG8_9RHOB|nr:NAD(P)H-dependent oxidoreductase [Tropicibacter naphthalenivorans]CUH74825.1 FMN-dependent NADH-azoreductase [Tropicibacter naphthalenivorans]SMC48733.1 FMN-dependent NADH-azoreductase [Tropicibacter naphthalenivorans]